MKDKTSLDRGSRREAFLTRYYECALRWWDQELHANLPRLTEWRIRSIREASAYLRGMPVAERTPLIRARLRLFHPDGSKLAGDLASTLDVKLQTQWAVGIVRYRRGALRDSIPDWRESRAAVVMALRSCATLGAPVPGGPALRETTCVGWRLRTFVEYRPGSAEVEMWHDLHDDSGYEVQRFLGPTSWLGIGSIAPWEIDGQEAAALTAQQMISSAERLTRALPYLIEGDESAYPEDHGVF